MSGAPDPSEPSIEPDALMALLCAEGELALLDVREARAFHAAHLNLAKHAPLSGLALRLPAFLPRRDVEVVLCDDAGAAGAAAERAGALLARLGYSRVRRLRGGLAAWQARGLPVIDGWNTLVKAFGDRVRRHYGTRVLPLSELRARMEAPSTLRLVDVRPADEFAFLSIAGARNHAGPELALRDFGPAGDAAPLWAVHCFSRTRGILGATGLQLLGHRHAAFVEDGVMAWTLRGGAVARDAQRAEDLPVAAPEVLRARAIALRNATGIEAIDAARLAAWQRDPVRTLHVFDLRPDAPGSIGSQLPMHFDELVGTRGARVVLVDEPHGLRAALVAFWLRGLNQCEVAVLEGEAPPAPAPLPATRDDIDGERIDAGALAALLAEGETAVIDVGPSDAYEAGHVPDAFYLLPATLEPLEGLPERFRTWVFTSPDGAAARHVARDARGRWPALRIAWLEGGTAAWTAEGRATRTTHAPSQRLSAFDDDWGSVMRVAPGRRDRAWADYLAWERALADRVAADPSVRFRFAHIDS